MIVTDDAHIAALSRSLRNQGRDEGTAWLAHARLGYNFRLSDINCALGIAQLGRIGEIIAERDRVYQAYRSRLEPESRVKLQQSGPDQTISRFVFVIRLADTYESADRDRILNALRERGIQCSNYFAPIHLQPFYVERFGFAPGAFPICEALAARTIALPFHHELTKSDIDRVCETLRGLL